MKVEKFLGHRSWSINFKRRATTKNIFHLHIFYYFDIPIIRPKPVDIYGVDLNDSHIRCKDINDVDINDRLCLYTVYDYRLSQHRICLLA